MPKKITIADRLNQISKDCFSNKTLEVGFMSNATYPDGTKVAEVAYTNEYGDYYHNIPARPFMRETAYKRRKYWISTVEKLLERGNSIDKAFSILGEVMVGDIKESIIDFDDPPNAPYTIQEKGFNDPLIKTGHMLKSVTSRLKNES